MSGGQIVVASNGEIAENADVMIRCPDATGSTRISWQVRREGGNSLSICARDPTDSDCITSFQSPQYQGRVTQDTSGGPGSERYSIRVSRVLLNESGEYYCMQQGEKKDKKKNVRIIGKLHFA